jgi:hypothetical protein
MLHLRRKSANTGRHVVQQAVLRVRLRRGDHENQAKRYCFQNAHNLSMQPVFQSGKTWILTIRAFVTGESKISRPQMPVETVASDV